MAEHNFEDEVLRRLGAIEGDLQRIDQRGQGNAEKLAGMSEALRATFLPKDTFEARFGPIERLVYGVITMVGIAVLTGILALVLVKK